MLEKNLNGIEFARTAIPLNKGAKRGRGTTCK
jgi:hypothetical protein